ncbi:hypothetical protein BS78_K128400 [Paspalum vaginatum]|uniref:Uncharacterized protein n=1 Tax=Paspalum vaginatum TaxID=158149 RepID=A0A9W8CDT1_9POAL|nr:hypothetical protein BS78_K128400 [Paspalum vaginatum]
MSVFLLPSSSSSRREGKLRRRAVNPGRGARELAAECREREEDGELYPLPQTAGEIAGRSATSAPGRRGPAVQYAGVEGFGRRGLGGKVESRAAKLGAVTVELGSGRKWLGASSRFSGNGGRARMKGEKNQRTRARGGELENRLGLALAPWRAVRAVHARQWRVAAAGKAGAWPRPLGAQRRVGARGGERRGRRVGEPGLWTTVADRWGQSQEQGVRRMDLVHRARERGKIIRALARAGLTGGSACHRD